MCELMLRVRRSGCKQTSRAPLNMCANTEKYPVKHTRHTLLKNSISAGVKTLLAF